MRIEDITEELKLEPIVAIGRIGEEFEDEIGITETFTKKH